MKVKRDDETKKKWQCAFAVWLTETREGCGITMSVAADRIGMHKSTWTRLEKGSLGLSPSMVENVAQALNANIEDAYAHAGMVSAPDMQFQPNATHSKKPNADTEILKVLRTLTCDSKNELLMLARYKSKHQQEECMSDSSGQRYVFNPDSNTLYNQNGELIKTKEDVLKFLEVVNLYASESQLEEAIAEAQEFEDQEKENKNCKEAAL